MDFKTILDELILSVEPVTSSSERCTLAPSLFATGVPPSTVGIITTPDWLFVSCSSSWLGSWVETSCWKVELLCNAGKRADHCQYHVFHKGCMMSSSSGWWCGHTKLFLDLVGNTHDSGPPAPLPALIKSFYWIQRLECGTWEMEEKLILSHYSNGILGALFLQWKLYSEQRRNCSIMGAMHSNRLKPNKAYWETGVSKGF